MRARTRAHTLKFRRRSRTRNQTRDARLTDNYTHIHSDRVEYFVGVRAPLLSRHTPHFILTTVFCVLCMLLLCRVGTHTHTATATTCGSYTNIGLTPAARCLFARPKHTHTHTQWPTKTDFSCACKYDACRLHARAHRPKTCALCTMIYANLTKSHRARGAFQYLMSAT